MTERRVTCCVPDCNESIPSSKFDTIRAGEQGWFFTKTGEAYCPRHVPDWVPAWRERQKEKR